MSRLFNLPPVFPMLDHFVFVYRRSAVKSSVIFYKEIFEEVHPDDIETGLSVPIGDLRPRYAKYCFMKHLK